MNRLSSLILIIGCLLGAQTLKAQLIQTVKALPVKMVTFKVQTDPSSILETDMYFTDTSAPMPVILMRTPYPRRQYTGLARFFSSKGYIMVVQSVRGSGGSTGQMVPFINETKDGLAMLDYLEKQPWCNGKVGMYGASYAGFSAITLGNTGHKTLKAIVSLSGWSIPNITAYPNGVNHLMLNIPWMLFNFSQGKLIPGRYNADSLLQTLPIYQMFKMAGVPVPFDQMEEPVKLFNKDFSYKDFSVPIMQVAGAYDFTKESTLSIYDSLRKYNKPQTMVFGPWIHDQLFSGAKNVGDHVLPNNQVGYGDTILQQSVAWFNRYLKDQTNDQSSQPGTYRLFPVWGDSSGMLFQRYPEERIQTKTWYLQKSKSNQSAQNTGDLSSKNSKNIAEMSFTSDPYKPVPTNGGANFHMFPEKNGVRDQSAMTSRTDVLLFTSEALNQDMFLIGKAGLRLFGSWKGKDCDFTAKILAVDPENHAWIMSDAIARMSLASKIPTNQKDAAGNNIYGFDLDLGHMNFMLKKGWKIRIEVAGSNFPKYERNAGTGENSTLATSLQAVQQSVWTGKLFDSYLTLETFKK